MNSLPVTYNIPQIKGFSDIPYYFIPHINGLVSVTYVVFPLLRRHSIPLDTAVDLLQLNPQSNQFQGPSNVPHYFRYEYLG